MSSWSQRWQGEARLAPGIPARVREGPVTLGSLLLPFSRAGSWREGEGQVEGAALLQARPCCSWRKRTLGTTLAPPKTRGCCCQGVYLRTTRAREVPAFLSQFLVFLVAASLRPIPLLVTRLPSSLKAESRGQSIPAHGPAPGLGLVPAEDDPTPPPVVEGRAHFPAVQRQGVVAGGSGPQAHCVGLIKCGSRG